LIKAFNRLCQHVTAFFRLNSPPFSKEGKGDFHPLLCRLIGMWVS
jgi:hypothetical protein